MYIFHKMLTYWTKCEILKTEIVLLLLHLHVLYIYMYLSYIV